MIPIPSAASEGHPRLDETQPEKSDHPAEKPNRMRWIYTVLMVGITAGSVPTNAAAQPTPALEPIETATVIFGADTILAEVADDYPERLTGLSGRTTVPDGTGMLFIFPDASERTFWMVDTHIDLDIAFMDSDFVILRVATMRAESRDLVDSDGPAQYALEVRAGWFTEKGIKVGDRPTVHF